MLSPREAADSVFRYIERTAVTDPDGTRWTTLRYDNKYVEDQLSVFNGIAGISLFLADYHRVTGHAGALELAAGGLRWAMARTATHDIGDSLCFGWGGVALTWLKLWEVRKRSEDLAACLAIAERIGPPDMTKPREWGYTTDYIGGVAGQGILLLLAWEATGDAKWLERARELGLWLATHAQTQGEGVAWKMAVGHPDAPVYWGFAHGLAGIGHFMARLSLATGERNWRDLCEGSARALEGAAVPDRGGLNWNRGPALEPASRCQWCHGAPGIGLFFLSAHAALKEAKFLALAEQAAVTTAAYGDCRGNPCQCHGLSGNGELFVELFRTTGASRWQAEAQRFAELAMAYRSVDAGGERWQADEPGHWSPDFMCGAAGAGHFFLRIAQEGRLLLPMM